MNTTGGGCLAERLACGQGRKDGAEGLLPSFPGIDFC